MVPYDHHSEETSGFHKTAYLSLLNENYMIAFAKKQQHHRPRVNWGRDFSLDLSAVIMTFYPLTLTFSPDT